ncbi:MAG: 4Fe-4S dicluster domain-containing protein [Dermatophilaceae bacterium]
MAGVRSAIAIVVDPDVSDVGIDHVALVGDLRRLGIGRPIVVPGLARHPELLTGAVKSAGVRRAVVVSAELGHPPLSELRMWGEAAGLAPLGVNVVALDILRAQRSTAERSAYSLRMVRAAVAALVAPANGLAVRRPVGASLSRRALLNGRATTWVPVVEVQARTCLGTQACGRCVQACPADALQIQDDLDGASPVVDVSRCEACSGCLDVCPTGALSLDGHDPGAIAQTLRALLSRSDGLAPPSLVIACRSAVQPLHDLGERSGLPGWLVMEVACLGGVGSAWHLAALAAGAPSVQLLPCERCMDRGFLTKELAFTRKLLQALGDIDASRRVGILPPGGRSLKRAVQAAGGLRALVAESDADPMPAPDGLGTSAWAAAWAVGEIARALTGPVRDQDPRPQATLGEGAPLGILRATQGCTACGVCARSCPTSALSLTAEPGGTALVLDPAACTGCAVCVQTCPESVLEVVRGVDLELLGLGRSAIALVAVAACPDCGENVPALPATAHRSSMPAELAQRCPRCRQAALAASV